MSKRTKIIMIISISITIGIFILLVWQMNNVRNLQVSNDMLESVNMDLKVQNDSIKTGYATLLSIQENEYVSRGVYENTLNELESLEVLVKLRQEEYNVLFDIHEELKKDFDRLDSLYYNSNYVIKSTIDTMYNNNKMIKILMTEKEIIDLFGLPNKETISTHDSGETPFFSNTHFKLSEYNDFILFYIGDTEGKNYIVNDIEAKNNNTHALLGLKIGDNVESLFKMFSKSKNESRISFDDPETVVYYICDGFIEFNVYVKDGIITKMISSGIIP